MAFIATPVWNSTSPISTKNGIGVSEKLVTEATPLRTTCISPGSPPRNSSAPTRLTARKAKPAGRPEQQQHASATPNSSARVCHQSIGLARPGHRGERRAAARHRSRALPRDVPPRPQQPPHTRAPSGRSTAAPARTATTRGTPGSSSPSRRIGAVSAMTATAYQTISTALIARPTSAATRSSAAQRGGRQRSSAAGPAARAGRATAATARPAAWPAAARTRVTSTIHGRLPAARGCAPARRSTTSTIDHADQQRRGDAAGLHQPVGSRPGAQRRVHRPYFGAISSRSFGPVLRAGLDDRSQPPS